MKTCETCKHFEREGYYRYCNKWWMSEEGSIVLPTDPLAEVVLDTPEGFGCTSHEEEEEETVTKVWTCSQCGGQRFGSIMVLGKLEGRLGCLDCGAPPEIGTYQEKDQS